MTWFESYAVILLIAPPLKLPFYCLSFLESVQSLRKEEDRSGSRPRDFVPSFVRLLRIQSDRSNLLAPLHIQRSGRLLILLLDLKKKKLFPLAQRRMKYLSPLRRFSKTLNSTAERSTLFVSYL